MVRELPSASIGRDARGRVQRDLGEVSHAKDSHWLRCRRKWPVKTHSEPLISLRRPRPSRLQRNPRGVSAGYGRSTTVKLWIPVRGWS
jgi:hypothetical protein